MSTQITSKEVLNGLNYLGYNNINAMQLKEFVKDLKKLIKYEERRKSEFSFQNEQCKKPLEGAHHKLVRKENDTVERKQNVGMQEDQPFQQATDIFDTLYSQTTVSSKAKVVPKKESVILLQVKRSKCVNNYSHQNKENICDVDNKDSEKLKSPANLANEPNSKPSSTVYKKRSITCRSKSSFIRPPIPVNTKSDPVALYHQYKTGWERQKFPGESQRADLRWAVREKMLSRTKTSRM